MKLSKANLVLIVFIVEVLSSFMGIAQTKTAQISPNIIFILTDDQGWTSVSHLANPNIPESKSDFYETPNMDKLAKMGVLFTQGYAPNPICSPTRNESNLDANYMTENQKPTGIKKLPTGLCGALSPALANLIALANVSMAVS